MSTRREFIKNTTKAAMLGALLPKNILLSQKRNKLPNILWLSVEDMSPHLGCYGYKDAITPNIDKLAAKGIRFTNAFTVAGVCAPTRSSIITGMYPTTTGVQNMRSGGEGKEKTSTPKPDAEVKFFTEYLIEAGYYCTNNYKEDYNFITPSGAWDESSKTAHWKNRPTDKPFFAVFNYVRTHEGSIKVDDQTHEEYVKRSSDNQRQNYDEMTPPPYYPNTQTTRKYWGRYLELITAMDYWVGDNLKELEKAGIADDTIVMFWSDHGVAMPRAKRWIYDSGTHVPLIVYIPTKYRDLVDVPVNGTNDNLISTVDFAPTMFGLTGLKVPDRMKGSSFLSSSDKNEYVFSIRDRMDERYEVIRSVRDKRYRYILNFTCHKPYYQHMEYSEKSPVMKEIRRVQKKDKVPEIVSLYTGDKKPQMELYDIKNDPHEINNLAYNSDYESHQQRMHEALLAKMFETNDLGLIPEPELVKLSKKFGSRYKIGKQTGFRKLLQRLINTALIAGKPLNNDLEPLLAGINYEEASVRYWACIGLGNLKTKSNKILKELITGLKDESSSVRVAAAEALIKHNQTAETVEILTAELKSDEEWTRLMAIIVLDENIELTKLLSEEIEEAAMDKENKYVARVAKHALNTMKD